MSSNFELTITVNEACNETTARDIFGLLAEKIRTQGISEITFKSTNDFFVSDEKSGFNCN